MPHPIHLSVFFPCYNDSKTIGSLVEDAIHVLKKLTNNYEVIVIDDGSTDTSRSILKELLKKYAQLKVVFHEKNIGYGGAIQSGFKKAQGKYIFYTDGDGQYDVKEITNLVGKLKENVTFVNGIKINRSDPFYRIIIGKVYNYIVRLFFFLPVADINCDFRLIKSNLLKNKHLQSRNGAIGVELVKIAQKNGAVFAETPVSHYPRRFGRSQFFRPKQIFKTFYELIFLWIQLMIIDQFSDTLLLS